MRNLIAKIVVTISLTLVLVSGRPKEEDDNKLQDDLDVWEAPSRIKDKISYYHAGFDKENRPIWIMPFGKWDIRSIVEEGEASMKIFEKILQQWVARIKKSMEDSNRSAGSEHGVVFILDMNGYTLRQLGSVQTVTFVLKTHQISQQALAWMDYGFVVNLNFIAESLFNVARPIIGSFLENAEVSGTNRDKWVPKILKRLPRDQLPEYYGGFKNFTAVKHYGAKF